MDTKKNIINAARALFLENNFETINIRDICAMAEVTTGAFYYYIKSKQNLIFIFYEEFVQALTEKLNANAEADFVEKIFLIADYYIEDVKFYGYQSYKYFFSFGLYNLSKSSYSKSIYDLISDIVKTAILNNEIEEIYSEERITQLFLIIMEGSIFEWCVTDGFFDLKENMISAIRILMKELKSVDKKGLLV